MDIITICLQVNQDELEKSSWAEEENITSRILVTVSYKIKYVNYQILDLQLEIIWKNTGLVGGRKTPLDRTA